MLEDSVHGSLGSLGSFVFSPGLTTTERRTPLDEVAFYNVSERKREDQGFYRLHFFVSVSKGDNSVHVVLTIGALSTGNATHRTKSRIVVDCGPRAPKVYRSGCRLLSAPGPSLPIRSLTSQTGTTGLSPDLFMPHIFGDSEISQLGQAYIISKLAVVYAISTLTRLEVEFCSDAFRNIGLNSPVDSESALDDADFKFIVCK
ncbi:hypothetical protein IW261DRAFT_1421556 [Armillaria novae-zelandiae]|uniref:Uncharacterized protein n=1 Tax=Armillaria novae-zelandiae TaxID=153914 RepID=A0AA39P3E7_9AGAR|nr:hypothetical protein IW261DRAFT_1421556 [Armillaria novae-zelandiae]